MKIWSSEIRELEKLQQTIQDRHPELEKELSKLLSTEDENMALVYARRCLETVITDLCECELERPRGSEPLKRIIDKLAREDKVPQNIIASMNTINSLSAFGAHPKEFDPQQVKPVLLSLATTLGWYLSYAEDRKTTDVRRNADIQKDPIHAATVDPRKTAKASGKRIWQISVSIILLATIAFILYPRLFPGDRYEEFRDESGIIRLVVVPFENLTGDQNMDWFSKGISSLLTNGLASSQELLVYNDQGLGEIIEGMNEVQMAGISGLQAREIAAKSRSQVYVTGSFQGRGDHYRILASLVGTENGEILFTRQVEGNLNSDNYLELADSLCNQIRDQLEIRALQQQADFDFRKAFTSSPRAYRHYIEGMNALVRSDFDYAAELLKQALEIDSSFAFAAFSIAMAYNNGGSNVPGQQRWVLRAMELKDPLPPVYQKWIELWNNCYFEHDLAKLHRQLASLESSGIESRLFWFDLGLTHHQFTGNLDQALEDLEKVAQISESREDPWGFAFYYHIHGRMLCELGRYQEGERMFHRTLELLPEESLSKALFYFWAVCAYCRGDSVKASELLENYRLSKIKLGEQDSYEFYRCRLYYLAKDYERAEAEIRLFLRDNPDHENGKMLLAQTLIEGELDPQEGLELINTLLDRSPEDIQLLDTKAYALHKLGRHREALELFEMNFEQGRGFNRTRHQWMQEVREAI